MSGQIINLNKARKAKSARDRKAQADENAVKFGRTKAERRLDEARNAQEKSRLDGHKSDE